MGAEMPQKFVGIACEKRCSRNSWWNQDWLAVSTPLKNMKISWDDELPNI